MKDKKLAHFLFPLAAIATLTPWISSAGALILGTLLALALGNPYSTLFKTWTHPLLAISVIGLGAGMNLEVVGRVGLQGIGYTLVGILTAFLVGSLLGKLLKVERDTSLLITMGTAICGGSAIATVAPVINAKPTEVSVALGTVFMLNAVALFIFPIIGHQFALNEMQFGLWSALAIHDTSSVVGATMQYGAHAVEVGTTVKLARALWIVPVAMLIGFIRSRKKNQDIDTAAAGKAKKPWFILGFLIAAALVTWVPALQGPGHQAEAVAKKLMVLTLFLIGSSLTRETIKSVGMKPFVQGILLWIFMATSSLTAIGYGFIH